MKSIQLPPEGEVKSILAQELLGITNCKIIISIWKTYTITIVFQNSNSEIVIKPFLRSEKMKVYFYNGTP